MTVVVLTSTGSGTWKVPADCPAGTPVTVECWGAGSGANGQTGTSYGAGGAGGAYAGSTYIVSPNDAASGISYVIGAGTAGLSGSNPAAGGNTTWSTNNLNLLPNSTNVGAVMPSTLPIGWYAYTGDTGLTISMVGFGIVQGLPYIDIGVVGTVTGATGVTILLSGAGSYPNCATVASSTYVCSTYTAIVGGNMTNVGGVSMQSSAYTGTTWVASNYNANVSTTSTLTQNVSTAFTTAAATNFSSLYLLIYYSTGAAINVTLRIAAGQFELGSTATAFKGSPGYTLAQGGGGPVGNTGGIGSAAASIGSIATFAGGSGAAYNASGSGGGGAGGHVGAGGTGTTAGVGGQGDGTTGGAGGAVKATTPGNTGVANVEGGGGGGGLKTVAGTGGVGGAPGGGGGGAAVATGTGGTGGRGQIRLTYTAQFAPGVIGRPPMLQLWDH